MRALITGASGGIGAELARLLAADRYDLVLVARDAQALDRMAGELRTRHGVSVRTIAADLARPGAAERLWADLGDAGGVDVLVNNAGVGLHGPLAEVDPSRLQDMVLLNVATLTALTRLALPPMLGRGRGRILNVASVAAYQPGGPGMAAYYASKAYVLSFSRGLARELLGSGVSVTALCPGPTATGFATRADAGPTRMYRRTSGPDAAAVALAGYRGLMRGRMVVIPGLMTKLIAFAGGLPPRRIALEVNRLLLATPSRSRQPR
jgi:uncharacterized protein